MSAKKDSLAAERDIVKGPEMNDIKKKDLAAIFINDVTINWIHLSASMLATEKDAHLNISYQQ